MNSTMILLKKVLRTLKKEFLQEDAAWQQLREAQDRLYEELLSQHRQDKALLHQIDELLSAQQLYREYTGEYQFFLGLQMGLELGTLRAIPPQYDE